MLHVKLKLQQDCVEEKRGTIICDYNRARKIKVISYAKYIMAHTLCTWNASLNMLIGCVANKKI
jgi:hypothetical protein